MASCVADPCLAVHASMSRIPPLVDFWVFKHPVQSESKNAWVIPLYFPEGHNWASLRCPPFKCAPMRVALSMSPTWGAAMGLEVALAASCKSGRSLPDKPRATVALKRAVSSLVSPLPSGSPLASSSCTPSARTLEQHKKPLPSVTS